MSRKTKAEQFAEEGYKIHVTGRNVLVTDFMKDYAIEKISKIERFTNRIIDVVVTMDIQKLEHRVDIVLKVDHIKIKSSASSEDMYASIDKAVDKIQSQLRKYKTKIQDHHARKLAVTDMIVNVLRPPVEEEVLDVNEQIVEETQKRLVDTYKPHEVVNKEKRLLKTLMLDEAILKMELSGDVFLIFRDEVDQKLKVIYRRNDGNYGLIHPEA